MGIILANAEQFFDQLVAQEMQRIEFNNSLVRAFLAQLITGFMQSTERYHVFYPPAEEALVRILPEAGFAELEMVGEQLLFGIGFFPESFRARGKRTVDIGYYIGIEKTIVHKLGQWNGRWYEVDRHFPRTIATINGVRSRTQLNGARIVRIASDVEIAEPVAFF